VSLREEDIEFLTPLVAQVANHLKGKYPMLDRADLAQECWAWALSRPKKVAELADEGNEALTVWLMRQAVRAWAEKEKAARAGYSVDDLYWYTTRELAVLVEAMLDPAAWHKPLQDGLEGRSGGGDPAVGGNWVATLADVSRAFSRLSEPDRRLLFQRYRMGLSAQELARWYGVSKATTYRWVEGALRRLQEQLGGERPEVDRVDDPSPIPRRHRRASDLATIAKQYDDE
jgi:RNA polymerase sigma factor (sigma-70 family)